MVPCWTNKQSCKGVSLQALCLEPDQLAYLLTWEQKLKALSITLKQRVLTLAVTSWAVDPLSCVWLTHHLPGQVWEVYVVTHGWPWRWLQTGSRSRWDMGLWPPIALGTEWRDRSFLPALFLYFLSIQEISKTFAAVNGDNAPWKSSISIMPVWHRMSPVRFLKQANRFQAMLLQGKESTVRSQGIQ